MIMLCSFSKHAESDRDASVKEDLMMKGTNHMKKRISTIICMVLVMVLIAGCSGSGGQSAGGSASGGSGGTNAAQSVPGASTEDKSEESGESPYGLSEYNYKWEPRLSEERYDMLKPLNGWYFAAGKKTGEKDENGNDVYTYQIMGATGEIVESPAFSGFRTHIGDEAFTIQVDEGGQSYEILYDYDYDSDEGGSYYKLKEVYSTKDDEDGFVEIIGYTDRHITMRRFTEPDENGNRWVECKIRPTGEFSGARYATYRKGDIWAYNIAPFTRDFHVVSSYSGVDGEEAGWFNYIQYERQGRSGKVISIHLDDTNYVYSYSYAPNFGMILVQKFSEEADANGNRAPGELGLYNVYDGTYLSLGDYAGWGTWPTSVGKHPVSEEGLVMLCESNEEHHRHAVYDIYTEKFLLTEEDGYGEISLDGNIWNEPFPASNADASSWTFLEYTYEQDENHRQTNTALEPTDMWFDDVTAFSGGKAFVKAPDGLWYGIMDNKFSPAYEDGEETRFTVCTEGLEADDLSVLAQAGVFAAKEGEQYRIMWFYDEDYYTG